MAGGDDVAGGFHQSVPAWQDLQPQLLHQDGSKEQELQQK